MQATYCGRHQTIHTIALVQLQKKMSPPQQSNHHETFEDVHAMGVQLRRRLTERTASKNETAKPPTSPTESNRSIFQSLSQPFDEVRAPRNAFATCSKLLRC